MFHHFPTKESLLASLYERAFSRYQAALLGALERTRSARTGVRALVTAHVEWTLEHAGEARILHEFRKAAPAPSIDACNAAFAARIDAWLQPHVRSGAVRRVPIDAAIALVLGPAHALARVTPAAMREERLRALAPTLADGAWAALSGE
jgi:AcrR family transcriptional regulator